VFEDADIEAAIQGCMIAKMRNGGQSCIAANRIYVHEAVAKEFTGQLAAAMGAMKVGPGLESGVDLGPVINQGAAEEMEEKVETTTGRGTTVRLGGRRPDRPGFFFEPTLLTDVMADDPILDAEVFGPIAPVVTFSSEDEAITMANDTIYGLASYVYTKDLARGMRVAEAIEAGMVGLNRGLISDPAAPFGGVKQSGLGREGSHEGMMEFLETKYIAADWR
jgi:succinate-semialdehyde dehydrogenase/glutarate-semialdehyde dehydrogenase